MTEALNTFNPDYACKEDCIAAMALKEHLVDLADQPKYKRVDLETLYKNTCNCEGDGGPCMSCAYDFGWNEIIDEIKSKYGDLYVEVK